MASDGQARKRSGADFVHEQQTGDYRDGADQTAHRAPTRAWR
jgi:hypothetical protein